MLGIGCAKAKVGDWRFQPCSFLLVFLPISLVILFLVSCSTGFLDHLFLCLLVPYVLGVWGLKS